MVWLLVFVAVVAALTLVVEWNRRRFEQRLADEERTLRAALPSAEPPARPSGLPPPVARYHRLAVGDARAVATLRMRHGGTFCTSPAARPVPIRGEQIFTADPPGFLWTGQVRIAPGAWIDARDFSMAGKGSMRVLLDDTLTIADAHGPEVDQGSALRLLAEMPWYPTVLFDARYVSWSAIDAEHARATLRLGNLEVSGVFEFGGDGLPVRMTAERFMDKGGLRPWGGVYRSFRTVRGLRVPFEAEVTWQLESGPFTYAHWLVDSMEYEEALRPHTQRVVLLRKFGAPEELVVVEQPVPEPQAGEVLVKVLAASVQFTDVILRKGRYPDLEDRPPLILGYDVVGEVVRLGPGVTSLSAGQCVADLTVTGSYAQYRALKADRVTPVDATLDPAQVTSLVLSWTTAYQLLHREARVREGQKILVLGAAGAVGQALVVLGRLAGCAVWAAARARHEPLVRALGGNFVDSDHSDLAGVRPEGFDVVFDGIGEQGFSRAWRAVSTRGHLSAYGFSAGVQANAPMALLGLWFAKLWFWNAFSGARSARFFSVTALRKKHPGWFVEDLAVLISMLSRGEIKPQVAERIQLGAVADAHQRLERGGLEGKIVLVPNA